MGSTRLDREYLGGVLVHPLGPPGQQEPPPLAEVHVGKVAPNTTMEVSGVAEKTNGTTDNKLQQRLAALAVADNVDQAWQQWLSQRDLASCHAVLPTPTCTTELIDADPALPESPPDPVRTTVPPPQPRQQTKSNAMTAEPPLPEGRWRGTLESFNVIKGYGFIKEDTGTVRKQYGRDVYVSKKRMPGTLWMKSSRVDFDLAVGKNATPLAKNVTATAGPRSPTEEPGKQQGQQGQQGQGKLRGTAPETTHPIPHMKKPLCRYFNTQRGCARGDTCFYVHEHGRVMKTSAPASRTHHNGVVPAPAPAAPRARPQPAHVNAAPPPQPPVQSQQQIVQSLHPQTCVAGPIAAVKTDGAIHVMAMKTDSGAMMPIVRMMPVCITSDGQPILVQSAGTVQQIIVASSDALNADDYTSF